MKKLVQGITGLSLVSRCVRIFDSAKVFRNKRVAIVGPANSVLKESNGQYIDGFDYVVRINKAPYALTQERAHHLGSRTDVLFHSFYENNETGGGPLNFDLYKQMNIKFVVNPRNNFGGWRRSFNFYKKYRRNDLTYMLPGHAYKTMLKPFPPDKRPTVGYTALHEALVSEATEIFITGFTFFKTPYVQGYRDHLIDVQINQNHLKDHGIHDPDLEFKLFCNLLKTTRVPEVRLDKELTAIVDANQ